MRYSYVGCEFIVGVLVWFWCVGFRALDGARWNGKGEGEGEGEEGASMFSMVVEWWASAFLIQCQRISIARHQAL